MKISLHLTDPKLHTWFEILDICIVGSVVTVSFLFTYKLSDFAFKHFNLFIYLLIYLNICSIVKFSLGIYGYKNNLFHLLSLLLGYMILVVEATS
jgi:hypothetical protein